MGKHLFLITLYLLSFAADAEVKSNIVNSIQGCELALKYHSSSKKEKSKLIRSHTEKEKVNMVSCNSSVKTTITTIFAVDNPSIDDIDLCLPHTAEDISLKMLIPKIITFINSGEFYIDDSPSYIVNVSTIEALLEEYSCPIATN